MRKLIAILTALVATLAVAGPASAKLPGPTSGYVCQPPTLSDKQLSRGVAVQYFYDFTRDRKVKLNWRYEGQRLRLPSNTCALYINTAVYKLVSAKFKAGKLVSVEPLRFSVRG